VKRFWGLILALLAIPAFATIHYMPAGAGQLIMFGLAADSKPATANGTVFIEMDTGKFYLREGGSWVEKLNDSYGVGGGGAPTTVDYLVGTADAALSAEIVVGTSPGGELGGTWAGPTIDDGTTVTSWVMGASTATSPAANDNDTSLATSAFVQSEIDDGDLLTDNCVLQNDATPIPDSCVGDGTDGGGGVDTANSPNANEFARFTDADTIEGRTVSEAKTDLSLNNVDNTSDASKPVSTATQTALDLKAPLASPTFTGNPLGPTASANDSDTSLATTAFVQGEVDDLDNLSDNCTIENDATPIPDSCVGDGSDAGGAGGDDVVYTPTTADTAVNSTSDVTIVTRDVTSVSAGNQVIVDAWFTILNNSGATRVYVITLDCDGLFDIEISTGASAVSATLMHPFHVTAVCDIRSTSLAYEMVHVDGQLAAGIASGTDTTMAATHLQGKGWGTSASDATGTLTVALKVRSANVTATQTLRLHHFTIRKVTPT